MTITVTKSVRFARTEPLPTYVVALAVGPFELVNAGPIGAQQGSGAHQEGIDVTLDPKGQNLDVKRPRTGNGMVRIPVAGGDAEELPAPAEYQVSNRRLSASAVDARGRILVSMASKHKFYTKPPSWSLLRNHSRWCR